MRMKLVSPYCIPSWSGQLTLSLGASARHHQYVTECHKDILRFSMLLIDHIIYYYSTIYITIYIIYYYIYITNVTLWQSWPAGKSPEVGAFNGSAAALGSQPWRRVGCHGRSLGLEPVADAGHCCSSWGHGDTTGQNSWENLGQFLGKSWKMGCKWDIVYTVILQCDING